MATNPGILTEWPWKKLGNFKYLVLAPWIVQTYRHHFTGGGSKDRDMFQLAILPFLLSRFIHNQIWISFSRFQTARSKHKIVNKNIEFEQVDRERNWDDQILLSGIIFYGINMILPNARNIPWWRLDGAILIMLLHTGPVEFMYYWLHRALHHHFLYTRYHSHHHSSIVTEPITSVIHPFAEILSYFVLFATPILITIWVGNASILASFGYITYVDLMNNLGHCNFEFIPRKLFAIFPALKYLMYTPSFHSLHHTQFRTNYSLFMPLYDYLYGTADAASDTLYEKVLKGKEDIPEVVHLSHPTSLHSIYHMRLGFSSIASDPYKLNWYMWIMWPISFICMLISWVFGSVFTVENNKMDKINLQTWAVPRYSFQYAQGSQRSAINGFIDKAILDAEKTGVKVVSLGLLNQGEKLNKNGELYLQRHPNLKVRLVNGSSLATAVIVNSIPIGTKEVLIRGKLSKVAYATVLALCQKGIHIITINRKEFENLKLNLPTNVGNLLMFSTAKTPKVWLVGDGLTDKEQKRALKGTIFIPFSQFPPSKLRSKDCIYYNTPSLEIPSSLKNMHACENWLPRRSMSAWRVAGIIHALEGWDTHECGDTILNIEKVWEATLRHGFRPSSPV